MTTEINNGITSILNFVQKHKIRQIIIFISLKFVLLFSKNKYLSLFKLYNNIEMENVNNNQTWAVFIV